MDASKDSMEEATFNYLMLRHVQGTRYVTPAHMRELIDKNVRLAKPHLRHVSLQAIGEQLTFLAGDQLPPNVKVHRALKIFAIGSEPWTDATTVEYWFVDRDETWYWVKCTPQGGRADYSVVTPQHLVDRLTHDSKVSLDVLSTICAVLHQLFSEAAERARLLSDDLTKVMAALDVRTLINNIVLPSD